MKYRLRFEDDGVWIMSVKYETGQEDDLELFKTIEGIQSAANDKDIPKEKRDFLAAELRKMNA